MTWLCQSCSEHCGWSGPPFRWDEERRFLLRCELDAAFFHLYGLNRDDTAYILDTFPIVKRKDEEKFGDYRTKLIILRIYDAMKSAMDSGQPYQTLLNPPPGDPRCCHPQGKSTDCACGMDAKLQLPRRCAYYGGQDGPLTREHIFPEALSGGMSSREAIHTHIVKNLNHYRQKYPNLFMEE